MPIESTAAGGESGDSIVSGVADCERSHTQITFNPGSDLGSATFRAGRGRVALLSFFLTYRQVACYSG